ncbi:MAG: NADH-quinone oxidoreductase subunit J [Candidatus Glassbacteria bacterium]
METSVLIFYLFGIFTVISAGFVVFTKNVVYAAFSLLATLFGVAALYIFLGADFLAAIQVLIYVGGILVLIVFGVMLTHRVMEVELRVKTIQVFPAIISIGLLMFVLVTIAVETRWSFKALAFERVPSTTRGIGTLIMSDYLLPFEIVSILLLMALVGAVILARRER